MKSILKSRRRIALTASILLHLLLIAVLWVWYAPSGKRSGPASSVAVADTGSKVAAPERVSEREETLREAAEEQPEVTAEEIEKSISSQIEQAERLPEERQLSELERNLKKLDSIAEEESVREVSSAIAKALGLNSERYAPKEPSEEGTFDTKTAQMSDVRRSKRDNGQWSYQTVMVDAEGREMVVPLDGDDGERLYDTFELMKQYPMAEGVYRSVVMPMMQKMLQPESTQPSSEPFVIPPADVELPDSG